VSEIRALTRACFITVRTRQQAFFAFEPIAAYASARIRLTRRSTQSAALR